ncbi:MAG: hypothetical protein KY445_07805 [Armatimonadetes bacterium]|nr:hypothetical protein [Armatimonadota bacterium]
MATKKIGYDNTGKVKVEEIATADGLLARAISLNDKRPNAYTTTVGVDGFTVYIFEHKRATVKEFRRRLEELAEKGAKIESRPYPVLPENASAVEAKEWEELTRAEVKNRTAEAESLAAEMEAIFAEVNSCIRGWDFPDENGEQKKRPVDYQAEVEAENIGPSLVPLLFQRIWEKHTLGTDERQQSKRF